MSSVIEEEEELSLSTVLLSNNLIKEDATRFVYQPSQWDPSWLDIFECFKLNISTPIIIMCMQECGAL